MKVLFTQNVKGLGKIGDIKNVSDGYARNFLIPKKLVKAVTDGNIKEISVVKARHDLEVSARKARALELSQKLDGTALEIKAEANPEGHLYGSVHVSDIVAALVNQKHITIEESAVDIQGHIKTLGEHAIVLKLHPEVEARIMLQVVSI